MDSYYLTAVYYINKYIKNLNFNSDVRRVVGLYSCYFLLSKNLEEKNLVRSIFSIICELHHDDLFTEAHSQGWYLQKLLYDRIIVTKNNSTCIEAHTWLNHNFFVETYENSTIRFNPNLLTDNVVKQNIRYENYIKLVAKDMCVRDPNINYQLYKRTNNTIPRFFGLESYRNEGVFKCSVCGSCISLFPYRSEFHYNTILLCGGDSYCKLIFYDELSKCYKVG
jgi:hypothetical protein